MPYMGWKSFTLEVDREGNAASSVHLAVVYCCRLAMPTFACVREKPPQHLVRRYT